MDEDRLIGTEMTEADLVCKDCKFAGFPDGMPISRCLMYPIMKPFLVLSKGDCQYYEKQL